MPRIGRPHAISCNDPALYQRAVRRVDRSPRLSRYESVVFDDWPEGDDHLRWVVSARVSEIEAWAKGVRRECE